MPLLGWQMYANIFFREILFVKIFQDEHVDNYNSSFQDWASHECDQSYLWRYKINKVGLHLFNYNVVEKLRGDSKSMTSS